MSEELASVTIPKAPTRKRTRSGSAEAKRSIGIEIAALAYVAMENGDYVFPPGINRPSKAMNGIHQGELMRLAGYRLAKTHDIGREFPRTLGNKREFWQLVELFRIRRTDPMFRKEQENMLLGNILGDAMRLIAERLRYYPHQISTREAIDIVSKLIGAQVATSRTPVADDRASRLLDSLPEEQRRAAIDGLKDKAKNDLAKVEALEKAHEAADDGH